MAAPADMAERSFSALLLILLFLDPSFGAAEIKPNEWKPKIWGRKSR